jgi:hypothetical protein
MVGIEEDLNGEDDDDMGFTTIEDRSKQIRGDARGKGNTWARGGKVV